VRVKTGLVRLRDACFGRGELIGRVCAIALALACFYPVPLRSNEIVDVSFINPCSLSHFHELEADRSILIHPSAKNTDWVDTIADFIFHSVSNPHQDMDGYERVGSSQIKGSRNLCVIGCSRQGFFNKVTGKNQPIWFVRPEIGGQFFNQKFFSCRVGTLIFASSENDSVGLYPIGGAFPDIGDFSLYSSVYSSVGKIWSSNPESDLGYAQIADFEPRPLVGLRRIELALHRSQLAPENESSNASEDGGNTRADSGDHSPPGYLAGIWIIAGLGGFAIVCGIAVYCIDKRWPKAAWLPLVLLAIAALVACVQLGRLAKKMEMGSTAQGGLVLVSVRSEAAAFNPSIEGKLASRNIGWVGGNQSRCKFLSKNIGKIALVTIRVTGDLVINAPNNDWNNTGLSFCGDCFIPVSLGDADTFVDIGYLSWKNSSSGKTRRSFDVAPFLTNFSLPRQHVVWITQNKAISDGPCIYRWQVTSVVQNKSDRNQKSIGLMHNTRVGYGFGIDPRSLFHAHFVDLIRQSAPLEDPDTGRNDGSHSDENSSDYYRIAAGAFLLLCGIALLSWGIIWICSPREIGHDQPDNANDQNSGNRIALAAIILGWLSGVYGTILLLPALMQLAFPNGLSENIRIFPVVVPELKFGNVERQILFADLVECSDHPTLNQRPEPFNRIRVNSADDIFATRMVDCRVRKLFAEVFVADPLIGHEQTYFVGNRLADETFKRDGLDISDDAGNDVALAPNCASDDCLPRTACSAASVTALVFMPVLGEAADESLVNLDNTAEFLRVFDQSGPDLVAHFPSGLVGAEPHIPLNLERAHALLAGQHQMDDAKPLSEGFIRVLEDRSGDDGEPIASGAAWSAFGALPMPFAGRQIIDSRITATRAADAFGPSASLQIGFAGVLIREQFLELRDTQLMNWFWTLGHGRSPDVQATYHV
jgi:hypothetical protein